MKIACNPGVFTDLPPVSARPFWYYSENVRFRLGIAETIGLFTPLIIGGEPALLPVNDSLADFYADKDIVLFASGDQLHLINFQSETITEIALPSTPGNFGRWWFSSTETTVLCGRCNFSSPTYVFDRDTLDVSLLPNAPDGAMGAGIVNGILVKAGTDGFAGDGPRLVVRWSARRTDPSSSGGPGGPFGFEDWTPSDLNSSGEFLLEEGSQVIGGASTAFGFIAWTDTRTYLMQPRADSYVFTLSKISDRGLLAPKAYALADGRLWWYDATRTLNVYDGGQVRQMSNPMRHVSVDTIADNTFFRRCGMSVIPEYGEVVLHYPMEGAGIRELVYNYLEDAWYAFNLGRLAMTDAQGERASIGITESGGLFLYDLREKISFDLTVPPGGEALASATSSATPEPFDFFLMTNHISGQNAAIEALRARNASLSYTVAQAPTAEPVSDELTLSVRSWGSTDLADPGVVDTQTLALGQYLFQMRAGGKRMQVSVSGTGFRSLVRLGEIDLESDPAGEK